MKKIVSLLLVLGLCLCSVNALAAGKLNILQENFHVVPSYSTYAYAYAKVENSGDKPIKVNAGVLEIYDEEGEVITSDDYVSAFARYLQPGEYTYVRMYERLEDDAPEAADYMMTLTGKSESEYYSQRIPCVAGLKDVVDTWNNTDKYMYAVITNDTDEPLFDISIVLALLDADGNILQIEDDSLYGDRALTPGSSMIIRKEIYSQYLEYFAANGLEPVSVDAIAYVNHD